MAGAPMLSVVIPTYKEAENIPTLLGRIHDSMGDRPYEVIVVDDDSPDGTADAARSLQARYPVKVVVRRGNRGLSSAVLRGVEEAGCDIIAVMDADLSHSPEYLPKMLGLMGEYDIVVGSRLTAGGAVEEWPYYRKVISDVARILALPLTGVKDFLSGYFMFRRGVIEGVELNPVGYKILLEILVKGRYGRVTEAPIVFRNRAVGKSKMTVKTHIEYLKHLMMLYAYRLSRTV